MGVFLLVLAGWVFSVCLHEFGHAAVAFKGGDYTVREKGYLTLNPIHYTDPVSSLLLPIVFLLLGGIGLPGGAVYINDHLLRSKHWRTGVSLAGPAMNAILILVLCLPFWTGLIKPGSDSDLAAGLAFLVALQVSAILFNLLPIPPLDGFQAISPWMPRSMAHRMMEHSNTLFLLLFVFMWYVQPVNSAFWTTVNSITSLVGIDPALVWDGFDRFRFWKGSL
jgi:Zn-dependent protease